MRLQPGNARRDGVGTFPRFRKKFLAIYEQLAQPRTSREPNFDFIPTFIPPRSPARIASPSAENSPSKDKLTSVFSVLANFDAFARDPSGAVADIAACSGQGRVDNMSKADADRYVRGGEATISVVLAISQLLNLPQLRRRRETVKSSFPSYRRH